MPNLPGHNAATSFVYSNRVLAAFFSIGVALGSGMGYGFSQATSKAASHIEAQAIGLAEYQRVQPGMSLSEVEAILGRGTEVSRTQTTVVFVWRNFDRSSMTATFENSDLKSKAQYDLK